jgi:hypothetical protein
MSSWSSTSRLLLILALPPAVSLAACTQEETGGQAEGGRVAVGDVEATVDDAECAEPGPTVFGSGVAVVAEGELVIFDVRIEGDAGEATVRTLRGDQVVSQHVSSRVTARQDGDEYTIEGRFTEFDGPEQVGEVDGTVRFTCEADTDPGGGFVSVEGQQVDFDLVTCVETEDAYEARARSTVDADQVVTASRVLERTGWVDRLAATGTLAIDEDLALEAGDEVTAAEAEGGLFEVRGTRITAEGAAFGDDRVGSLDLTCGIDISTIED